jgi:hypothetical protein
MLNDRSAIGGPVIAMIAARRRRASADVLIAIKSAQHLATGAMPWRSLWSAIRLESERNALAISLVCNPARI